MLNEASNMPEYQWKLTIVERNLLLSNWMNLIPDAQEQMLWEANDLMEDLPQSDKQRLLTSLETLHNHTNNNLQEKIQDILNSQHSVDIRTALELNIQHTTLATDGLEVDSSTLVQSI